MYIETKKSLSFNISLDLREAQVLLAVLRNVGGGPTGPREVLDQLSDHLMTGILDAKEKVYDIDDGGSLMVPRTFEAFYEGDEVRRSD